MFSRNTCLVMLLLSLTACVTRPERRKKYKQPRADIEYNNQTGKIEYNNQPAVNLYPVTEPGLHFVRMGKDTTLLTFALKVERNDVWLEPGDTFVFTYQDYTGHPGQSADLRLLVDGDSEVALHVIKSLRGGQLFVKLYSPIRLKGGRTRYFSVVMDTTIFSPGDKLFIALQEFRRFIDEMIGSTADCYIRTTVRLQ